MRVFVVFINCGYSGWDHHVLGADSPEEALVAAKAKTKLSLAKVVNTEVTEVTDEKHIVIEGSM